MTSHRFSVTERRARLARRHHLLPSATAADVESVARRMVGLHATDAATVYLSAWARVPGLTVADVERSLYDELTVVRHLCMRRTLFVLPEDLVAITQVAATDAVATKMRKRFVKELEAEQVTADGDRWLDEAIAASVAAVAELGPSTGAQIAKSVPLLRTQLRGAGPVAAAVTSRVITLAAAEGTWSADGRRATGPAARIAGGPRPGDRARCRGRKRPPSWCSDGCTRSGPRRPPISCGGRAWARPR